jgi:ABC-2 type transport system permease protein
MAVHRRTYRAYEGALTTPSQRLLVLPRYALRDVFASRTLVVFFFACFVPALVEIAIVYLYHAPSARSLLHMAPSDLISIDERFFYNVLALQGGLALGLAAWIGPLIVAPDLANGALTLYLSRPISRAEYVAGKLLALLALLSAITWAPVLLVFAFQGGLAGGGWATAHLRIAIGTLLSSLLWIGLLAFLSVALSAWVRWRAAATGLFFAVFFIGAGMGELWNATLKTRWGSLLNLNFLIDLVWRDLFGLRIHRGLPIPAAWAVLVGVTLVCALLLDRRLRAREVVR